MSNASGNSSSDSLSLRRWLGDLQARSGDLAPSERRVIDVVLADPLFVGASTTAQVAARADVSPPSVVRAARAVGFEGFAELKLQIARARGTADFFAPPGGLTADATITDVVGVTLRAGQDALTALSGALRAEAVDDAIRRVRVAGQVLAFGAGPSATVAADAVFRLRALGVRTAGVQDLESALIAARLLRSEDVLVVVSSTGRTTSTLAVADAAVGAGATVVAITNQYGTPLASLADVVLAVGGPPLRGQMAAASSRLAQLTVVDVLAAGLALAEPDRRARAEYAGIDLPDID